MWGIWSCVFCCICVANLSVTLLKFKMIMLYTQFHPSVCSDIMWSYFFPLLCHLHLLSLASVKAREQGRCKDRLAMQLVFTSDWFCFVTWHYKRKPVTCKNELCNHRSWLTKCTTSFASVCDVITDVLVKWSIVGCLCNGLWL